MILLIKQLFIYIISLFGDVIKAFFKLPSALPPSILRSDKIESYFDNSEKLFIEAEETSQTVKTTPANWILFKKEFEEAFFYAKENRLCYYRGKSKWENYNGGNFSLLCRREESNSFMRVGRKFHTKGARAGLMELTGMEESNENKYNSCTALDNWYLQTYCNMLASVYSIYCVGFSLSYYGNSNTKKQWYNASKIYDMFCTGGYNNAAIYFKEVDYIRAANYSGAGGLVFAVWDNKERTAHIATLTINNQPIFPESMHTEKNIQVHNAGGKYSRRLKTFVDNYGVMNLVKAFGSGPVSKKEIKYFACFRQV